MTLALVKDTIDEARKTGLEWLQTVASDEVVECHAQGHGFEKLTVRKTRKGVVAVPQQDGAWQIQEPCRNCGTVRTFTTLPGGRLLYSGSFDYDYQWPKEYHPPKGSDLSKADWKQELWRRAMHRLITGG